MPMLRKPIAPNSQISPRKGQSATPASSGGVPAATSARGSPAASSSRAMAETSQVARPGAQMVGPKPAISAAMGSSTVGPVVISGL